MADNIKLLAPEVTLSATPTTVGGANLLRVINIANTNVLLTQRNSSNTIIATTTLGFAGSDNGLLFLVKQQTETVEVNTADAVLATAIGYY